MLKKANTLIKIVVLVLVTLGASSLSLAQGQSTVARPSVTPDYSSQTQVYLLLDQTSYTSDSIYDSSSQQTYEIGLKTKSVGSVFRGLTTRLGASSEPNSMYFSMPEAYVGFGGQKASVIAGRIVRPVSELENRFHFGLVNPYFSNDFLNYETQGLLGLHVEGQQSKLNWGLSWLGLFVPNQGPQLTVKENQIYSTNRWARRPPTTFQFGGENKRIDYAIRDYKLQEIISNQGAQARLGWNDRIQASYAYKPLNDIPLARDTYGTVVDFKGRVELSPVVTYHEVATLDLKIPSTAVTTTLSYMYDRPQNKKATLDETLQFLAPLEIYGLTFQSDLSSIFSRRLLVSLSMSDIQGGEIKDLLQNGEPSVFTFSSQRALYRQPVQLEVDFDSVLIARRPLQTQMRWIYDNKYKGSVLSVKFSYNVLRTTQIHLGADLLGTENDKNTDSNVSPNFIEAHSANDRIFGGLEYVF